MNDLNERMRSAGWCQVKEAARITGLPPRQIYRLIEKFDIPIQRFGGDGQHKPGRRGAGVIFLDLSKLFNVCGRTISTIMLATLDKTPPPEQPLSFTKWLRQQRQRDDAVSHFAAEWDTTDRRPRSNDWASILGRLCEHWHADEAAKMLRPAWDEYQLYRSQKIKERADYDIVR